MATTYLHVTVAGGAGDAPHDGSTWAKAMDMAEWLVHMHDDVTTDKVYYVAGGTYTLAGVFETAIAGTAAAPISVIGVLSGTTNEGAAVAVTDWAYTTNRPLIAATTNTTTWGGDYWKFYNLRATYAAVSGFKINGYSVAYNCSVVNSTNNAAAYAFNINNSWTKLISCEAVSTYGIAVNPYHTTIMNCYIHDSVKGINIGTYAETILNSVIDTCSTAGIILAANYAIVVVGNTIYNCGIGISGTTAYGCMLVNNIISGCSDDGADWTTETPINQWMFNCWNNTDDVDLVTKGLTDITGDPLLSDPANGNFTLGTGSPCFNAGLEMNSNVGVA